MSHQTTKRRNFSAPNPETLMDPTSHPKPTASATHPSDPSVTTVQNISNHFSRLYLNHKARSSLRTSTQPPPVDTHLQALSTVSDGSTTASLTKSQSQKNRIPQKRGKPHYYYYHHNDKPVKEQPLDEEQEDNIKRAIVVSSKIPTKKADDYVNLKSMNQEKSGDEMKKLQQGYDIPKQALSSLGMGKGRRRSFGSSSQAELADFFACNGVKVVSADMPPYMQIHVVDVTRKTYDSLEKFTAKALALTLKKEFDGVYGPAWHCIVGSSFGSFVTHSVGGFLYFSMDQKLYVLLFKTAVQRAH
ncbi:hypothetical protein L2E82_26743 [Cichorium intybus]|uniref:Uncharacterized protein n=1 Tax=Cichorium intybus TaxID=13427 RepID=A0ACB9CRG4_CICIN|nr:hypothetical protein L2E82_26743 [Cichorium intybus]